MARLNLQRFLSVIAYVQCSGACAHRTGTVDSRAERVKMRWKKSGSTSAGHQWPKMFVADYSFDC